MNTNCNTIGTPPKVNQTTRSSENDGELYAWCKSAFVHASSHIDSHLLNLPHILQSIVVVVEENQGLEAAQLHLVNLDQPKVKMFSQVFQTPASCSSS